MKLKPIMALILCLAMILSTMGTVAFANNAEADVWDGTVDTSWYNGTDTEFELTTAEQLAGLAELVNGGNTFEGKTINLGSDLDLSNEVWIPIGTSIYDKTPTDANVKMFAGNFDGGNHIITGLTSEGYVPESSETTSTEYSFGLFGYVHGANISNVKLAGVRINCGTREDSDGNNVGGSGVAALIGYYYVADGKACIIENCHVLDGTVSASNNMGGLIGFMDSQVSTPQNVNITIKNCSNSSNVTSEAREAGGILGLLNASREDYSPTMAGSITFKGCINTGDITTLDGGGSTCAGGILGKDQNEYSNQQLKIIFDECENSGTITVHASGETHVAGLGTSFYSSGTWLVAKNSSNTGNIVVVNPEICGSAPLYAGGLFAYAGVMDIIDSASTGTVIVGAEAGNTYVGDVSHILFLEGIDDFEDNINCYTYYLNGGTSPEFAALVDDVANWGGNFNVLVKTAYMTGANFQGWYDNAELTGTAYNALDTNVKTYYAKWSKYAAKIGDVCYTTLQEAVSNAVENDTIYLFGTINEGTIKLPATIRNLTIDGQESAVVKDTTINAADGNYVDVQGLTVKNTIFDNSRFVLGGMRAGDVIYKDLVFEGNTFTNIVAAQSMAAVHMNIGSEDNEYVENFKFINNTIDGVTGSSNSGVLMKNAKGDVIFEGNTISNVVNNAIQCINAKADINLVIKNNNLSADLGSVLNLYNVPAVTLENNTFNLNEGQKDLGNFSAVATIGNTYYANLQAAVDDASDGATITVLLDVELSAQDANAALKPTYNRESYAGLIIPDDKEVTIDLNGKTISYVDEYFECDNLAIINLGNLTINDSVGSGKITYKPVAGSSTYSKFYSTIFNCGTLTVNGGIIENTCDTATDVTNAVDNHSRLSHEYGNDCILVVNGGTLIGSEYRAIRQYTHYFEGVQNRVTINDGVIKGGIYQQHGDSWYYPNPADNRLNVDCYLTINGGTITSLDDGYGHVRMALSNPDNNAFGLEINGGTIEVPVQVYVQRGYRYGDDGLGGSLVTGDDSNARTAEWLEKNGGFISGGTFTELGNADDSKTNLHGFLAEGYDVVRTADKYVVEPENAQADSISVEYVDVTEAGVEGEKTYEIVVKANEGDVINELASVDLSFVYDKTPVTGGEITFEVAPATDFAMTRYENTNRYMFNYNGVDAFEGNGSEITVGTITVIGYGEFTIATADVDTNIVNATTVNDNLVDSYTVAGATDDDATTGALDISGSVDNGEIAVPTRTLKITIDFPNAIEANVADYQDMKVEITGTFNGVNKTVTYDLGEDMVDGSYVVEDANLVLNNAYTVTVSGAGYRTARYTVTMTEDKALRFWNNVMDEAQVVEIGKDSSAVNVTFLAGDIVKDNKINIYDLSAVVSYFGTETDTDAYDAYAKYDLNRDGVIDSKDVAYVLVSWDN